MKEFLVATGRSLVGLAPGSWNRGSAISCWVLLGCLPFSLCRASEGEIEGYLSSFSVTQGQSINIYTSTTSPTYDIQIFRLGTNRPSVKMIPNLPGASYSVPGSAWEQGAQWSNPVPLQIPGNWSTGLYNAVIKTADHKSTLSFSVKEDQPGTKSKILLLDNASTRVAYNNWGGKSLYTFNSSDNIKANTVSLLRPGQNVARRQQREFVAWADNMSIPIEYASMMDLQNNPSLLSNYDTVVLAGHSEYWSKDMRDAYDSFVQNGGNAMILSGNTMWWQIRLEGEQLVSYKNTGAVNDPLYGVNNDLITTNWFRDPVNDPENRSIGVSWRNGGYVNAKGYFPASEGYGGYTVTNADHWIYDGTTLENGDIFGQENTIAGFETDGALFTWVDGAPVVTGEDGTPLDFDILGYSPAENALGSGHATMGVFQAPGGGYVFNAATVDWADGLWDFSNAAIADQNVSIITYNTLKRFSASVVPAPPAFYLFASGLIVLTRLAGRRLRNRQITDIKTSSGKTGSLPGAL